MDCVFGGIISTNIENKIIRLLEQEKKRAASALIEKHIEDGGVIETPSILKVLLEPSGMTVAHKMALNGHVFNDPEILSLKGEDRSRQNAVYGHNGCSVAFILAKKGIRFDDPAIQALGANEGKSSVAHAMAAHKHEITDENVLKLTDHQGNSVAHILASNGVRFSNAEILNLKNKFGFSVSDYQNNYIESQSTKEEKLD